MNMISPVLACGPGGEIMIFIYAVLGGIVACAISLVAGIVCLCRSKKTAGLWLISVPLVLIASGAILILSH